MKWAIPLLLTAWTAQAEPAIDVTTVGQLASPRLTETSGIAGSRRDKSVIWGVNDSGNAPLLHAFSMDGSDLGTVRVNRGRNIDWEDLASFVLNDTPYLLIADTGDNRSGRQISMLLIVEEPIADGAGQFGGTVEIVTQVPFRFEDGPRDCEAVAVDVDSDRVLLVSKRDVPPAVYELPLTLVKGIRRPLVAKRIANLETLPRPTLNEMLESPLLGPWRHQPTAIDIAPDGRVVAMMTYRNLYLFRHDRGQDWGQSLAGTPRVLPLPALSQTEAVAFIDDRVIAVAEGRSAPVLSIGPIPR